MDVNTCFVLTEDIRVIAYYSHLVPIAFALFLSLYAVVQTKFSKLALVFFLFTCSFSLWLVGDLFPWTSDSYDLVYYTWSWLDFVNVVFFALGAYFFGLLARGKISLVEKGLLLLIIVPAFLITITGNSVVEFDQAICEAINNDWLTVYKLYAEIAIVLLMLWSFGMAWKGADGRKRTQITVIAAAILLFFGVFAGTEFVASVTGVYEINLYGLFILPLFLIVLTFAITDLRLFQLRFVGTQVLAYVLIIMVGSQLLFIQDSTSRNLSLITLAMSLFLGVLLIENAKSEEEARIKIEELAKELELANKQQVTLIHFITHQVKGFLTKSRNVFSMMLEGDCGPTSEQIHTMADEGFKSSTKGVDTVQEILNAANIRSGKVEYVMAPFDLKELIEEIEKDLRANAEGKQLAFTTDLGTEPLTIQGDRGQLINAYKNLIDNSIKYTPSGSVSVRLKKEKGKALFTVEDTGVGITPEDMTHLFTEGGHGKESQKINVESTGFGLYIVKSIVEAHKGRVWATSEGEGKGSRFSIEIPVAS